MQRRQSVTPPPPPQRSIAQLKAAQARIAEELERAVAAEEAERQRKATFEGSKVLIPASPSPRKKRARPEEPLQTKRPARPTFQDSTLAGPPVFSGLDALRAAQPAARESAFASHESALPRLSKFAAGIAQLGKKGADSKSRKDLVSKRSLGFTLASSASKKQNSEAPAANSSKIRSKGKEAERTSTRSATSREGSAQTERSPAARGGGMARHAPAPRVKASHLAVSASQRSTMSRTGSEREDEEDEDDLDITDGPTKPRNRNADGTLIEEIELGPIEHDPPPGDPDFETIEPNSGIRLKKGSRSITHQQMQQHLSDRYHLPPALVYSLARQVSGTDNIEIDVDADFIVIGVLAWKDEARFTKAQGGRNASKYIRYTLVDLSTEAAAASGTGTLTVSAFAADTVTETEGEDGETTTTYKGGSGGAYEVLWKESIGAVVAILNPTISKPPHIPGKPNIFTITPRSADSLMVIGRSKDLKSCQAMKADGKLCGSWCDGRVNKFCEWHVQRAIVGKKAARPEMANVSSSMSNTAVFDPKKFNQALQRGGKSTYNPDKKTGLLPDTRRMQMAEGVPTYVSVGTGGGMRNGKVQILAPHALRAAAIQSGNGSGGYIRGVREGPTVEQVKRDKVTKEKEEKRRKKEVKLLMKQDMGSSLGGEYVQLAAEQRKLDKEKARVARELEDKRIAAGGKVKKGDKKRRRKAESESSSSSEEDPAAEEDAAEARKRKKKAFSTEALRRIGYDPTNHKDMEDEESKRIRLSAISSLTADRPAPKLSAPPGPKVRSGVSAPKPAVVEDENDLPDPSSRRKRQQQEESDDDDDDLVVEGGPVRPMVKLARPPPRVTKSSLPSPSSSKAAASETE